jgi:hypothetical protein
MTKEEKENLAHNNYPHGSEMPIGSRDRSLYENKKESFLNGLNATINYTHCCTELVCPVCKSRRIKQDPKWEDNECLNCGKIWTN